MDIDIICLLIKPEERGFIFRKHMPGTITDITAKRLFEKKIIATNVPVTMYNATLNSIFLNLKIRTTRMLQAIESKHAKILGFSNVPTGYGAPCNNCIMPTYVSLNERTKRTINVTTYDSLLKNRNDNRNTE
ncbi:MAG: hypothetical protein MJY68_04245 [Bacteroidaceae bacterium]|nr:hypothetical protein [Bacteroidaceae bacterium]